MGMTLSILTAGVAMSVLESFSHPSWDRLRHLILASAVAFGIVPSVHWALGQYCTDACRATFFSSLIKMFGYYGAGFALFITRSPERFAPGWFDILGASHQWWHFFVWAAGATWFEGMLRYYEWRATHLVCVGGSAGLPLMT